MSCDYPIPAYRNGDGSITFNGFADLHRDPLRQTILIRCNQCTGCRLLRSSHWATRCWHESKTHTYNCWLTLTYADEHLPQRYDTGLIHPVTKKPIYSGSLHKEHPQKFIRALRKALGRRVSCILHSYTATAFPTLTTRPSSTLQSDGHPVEPDIKLVRLKPTLRYYYGGEYGEKYGRPHYHLCLFGIDFDDKQYVHTTELGYKLYESPTLTKLWKYGQHSIGELTWETAAYTARYIMKKITGKRQKEHYEIIDKDTGEILCTKLPEYNDMSRKPGIASTWLDKYHNDVYNNDNVIVRGKKTRPPRYYDKEQEKRMPEQMERIKLARQIEIHHMRENLHPDRLKAQRIIVAAKTKSLKRKL